MEKLIVTVTCDSTMSYPRNPYNPKGIDALADEYVRGVAAGASICHLHGPYNLDEKIRPDGTKLSDLDLPGWQRLKDSITGRCTSIIQYGIANGRFPQRVESMKQKPDMMSICFNAHDESFQPDPNYPAVELYGIHDRGELEQYCKFTKQYGVKPEVERSTTEASGMPSASSIWACSTRRCGPRSFWAGRAAAGRRPRSKPCSTCTTTSPPDSITASASWIRPRNGRC